MTLRAISLIFWKLSICFVHFLWGVGLFKLACRAHYRVKNWAFVWVQSCTVSLGPTICLLLSVSTENPSPTAGALAPGAWAFHADASAPRLSWGLAAATACIHPPGPAPPRRASKVPWSGCSFRLPEEVRRWRERWELLQVFNTKPQARIHMHHNFSSTKCSQYPLEWLDSNHHHHVLNIYYVLSTSQSTLHIVSHFILKLYHKCIIINQFYRWQYKGQKC